MLINRVDFEKVVSAVMEKSKYSFLPDHLVRMIAEKELSKGRSVKEAIKVVAGKLHQVGTGYFKNRPNYSKWRERYSHMWHDIQHSDARSLCREIMEEHNSTSERLPILEDFFHRTLDSISPLESILDLACGLNPLALSWMPVNENTSYYGCDIFSDLAEFLNGFFHYFGLKGQFEVCNLLDPNWEKKPFNFAQVTFLLKTLTCLDQLEKNAGLRLLEKIPSPYILVSYPVASLGGHAKGMRQNYENQFWQLLEGKNWQVEKHVFSTELAFLIKK